MKDKSVAITCGGTLGHVLPAKALFEALKRRVSHVFLCDAIPAGRFSLKHPFSMIGKNMLGLWQSVRFLRAKRIDLVVGFGSYHTFPMLLAARCMRIPWVLHEQNAVLGRVNRLFSSKALCTMTFFPDVVLKGVSKRVAWPWNAPFSRDLARFGLDVDVKTLLVFGGSQGARFINDVFLQMPKPPFPLQVLHLTGCDLACSRLKKHYRSIGVRAYVARFERDMGHVWGCVDFFVGRAGGGTVAESVQACVPGFLIPYPYALDDHQRKNADFFMRDVKGGAVFLQDEIESVSFFSKLFLAIKEGHFRQAFCGRAPLSLQAPCDCICEVL